MTTRKYHPRGVPVDGYDVLNHPNYVVWTGMRARCSNQNNLGYVNYGGRGIGYCPEWEDFAVFCRDMGVRPSKHYSIDRIDNDKGYCPANCKWSTRTEQALNRRKFSNNSTGFTGVVRLPGGRYKARYDEGGRYSLSASYETAEEASSARATLIALLQQGKSVDHLLERKSRYDSVTGIRGITPHPKGGYLVRATENKSRVYLGFFTTLDAAKARLEQWKQKKTSSDE